jgi:hypothetical protein
MANTTISALPSATTPLSGTEVVPIVQSGVTSKVAVSDIAVSGGVNSFQTSLSGLTPSTATAGVVTLAGTLRISSGGTGLTTFTAGDLPYYASGTALSKLGIGTAGQVLTSTGAAPQWSTLSGVTVTTFNAGTTGFTPSSATSGAVTLAGTLATTNGGTGLTSFTSGGAVYATSTSALTTGTLPTTAGGTALTSFTANGVVYASSSSALTTGSALTFNGTNLVTTGSATGTAFIPSGSTVPSNGMYLPTTNTVAWSTNTTERMRLDSSGNLGIGVSSPAAKLQVGGDGSSNIAVPSGLGLRVLSGTYQNTGGTGFIQLSGGYGDNGFIGAWNISALATTPGSYATNNQLTFSTVAAFSGTVTERMRLDDSGNLLVGTSAVGGKLYVVSDLTSNNGCRIDTPASFTAAAIISISATAGSTSWNHIAGNGNGGSQTNFIIYGNGNMVNANNSYGAVSDVKLKENIADASPKLADLMQVKVRNYNLIGETTKQIGVVAQELETVFPSMIDETVDKDVEGNELGTTTKQVKYSVFVPMLIKAMQEQQALIQSLTDRIAQLEAK